MSEKTDIVDLERLRDNFSMLLEELEQKRARLQKVEAKTASQSHELEAARVELDARKILIESLQGEAERTQTLEAQLKEKRDVISKLEAYIERHVSTLAELRQGVANWKEKYASLNSPDPSSDATTISSLPELTEEGLRSRGSVEDVGRDATAAIDMRPSSLEAQRIAKTKVTANR